MSHQKIKEILHNIDFRVDSSLQEPRAEALPILINLKGKINSYFNQYLSLKTHDFS